MHGDIDQILISQKQIAFRVRELAAQITADHAGPQMANGGITIVPIMTGAMVFCADLIRQMPVAMKIGLMMVSSYPGKSVTSQGPRLLPTPTQEQAQHIRGRHVLVIDDIMDSGGTIGAVVPALSELGAAGVRSCVLLRKDRLTARAVHVDYVGFEIPDTFVVGYGLDYNDYYRNVPDIVTLKGTVFQRPE
jgi:hypoxanthine phosphoribosyltransferase